MTVRLIAAAAAVLAGILAGTTVAKDRGVAQDVERVPAAARAVRAHQVVVERTCNITIQPGASGSCTFRNAGRFSYREPAFRGTAWRGTITVRALPRSLTIAARPQTVTYGGTTTLGGAVSSAQANERVSVTAGACGSTSFATRVAATSAPTG